MCSFSSFIFFLRKTLGDQGCLSPASFSSFPSHRGCALALPGHHSSSLGSPPWGHHAAFAPLSSSNRWALTLWYLKRNSGAPGTLYFFFPPKEDPSCTSYLLLVIQELLLPTPSILQVENYSLLLPCASKAIWIFLWLFHQTEAFARLTAFLASLCFDRKAFFPPAVLPSTLLPLTLCFCARIACRNGAYMRI